MLLVYIRATKYLVIMLEIQCCPGHFAVLSQAVLSNQRLEKDCFRSSKLCVLVQTTDQSLFKEQEPKGVSYFLYDEVCSVTEI